MEVVYNEFADREKEMITGTVQRERNTISIGCTEGLLALSEQVPGNAWYNQRMKLLSRKCVPLRTPDCSFPGHPGLVILCLKWKCRDLDGVVEIFRSHAPVSHKDCRIFPRWKCGSGRCLCRFQRSQVVPLR